MPILWLIFITLRKLRHFDDFVKMTTRYLHEPFHVA